VFEAVLGLVLIVGAATGGLGAADFPAPVGSVVLAAVGCLLLVLAVVLWRGGISVAALAAGNWATAVVAVVWFAAASGFSTAGASLVLVVAVGLVCLAAAQVATLRPSRSRVG
jgi:hypothetical protein